MFLLAFLSFCFGIYGRAIHPLSIRACFAVLLLLVLLYPFSRPRILQAVIILSSFFIAGLLRMGLNEMVSACASQTMGTFKCVVTDTSKGTATLRIKSPKALQGQRVIYRTQEGLRRGNLVWLQGKVVELEPTFKNPSMLSLASLKRLEGVGTEIRGHVLCKSETKDPFERLRMVLSKKVDSLPLKNKGLIKAITIGDTLSVDREIKDLFARTGTSHILAISGTHLGLITASLFYISRRLARRVRRVALAGNDKRYAAIFTIPFVVFYVLLSGRSIPTIRSAIMAEAFLFSCVIERERDIINTIVLSAFIILLFFPHSLFTASFQLTYMSVVSIILFHKAFYPHWRSRIFRYLTLLLSSSISAFLGTAPIVLYHFYGLNPFSFLHNLFAVPLICGLSLPLSLIGLFTPLSSILLPISDQIIDLSLRLLSFFDFGYLYPLPRPTLQEALIYYAFLFSFVSLRGRRLRLSFAVLIFVSCLFCVHSYRGRYANDVCFNFIDVGDGLSVLIEGKKGERMLIDGGGQWSEFDVGKKVVLPILLSKKILKLDHVVNTHPHMDHLGGLFHVVEHMHVGTLHVPAFFFQNENLLRLVEAARKKGADVNVLRGGNVIRMREIAISVLHPSSPLPDPNDASLVLRIEHAGFFFLIPSDIGGEVEGMLIRSTNVRSHVLLVPHHGSARSSTLPFLVAVKPSLAVLSVGQGVKGLPSPDALERYERLGIPLLSTQRNGLIKVCIRKGRLCYKTFSD